MLNVFFKLTLHDLNYWWFYPELLYRQTCRVKPIKRALLLWGVDQAFSDTLEEDTAAFLPMRPKPITLVSMHPSELNSWLPNLNTVCSWSNYQFTAFNWLHDFIPLYILCNYVTIAEKKNQTLLKSKVWASFWDTQRHKALKQTFAHRINSKQIKNNNLNLKTSVPL